MSLPTDFPKAPTEPSETQPKILFVCLGNICRSPSLEIVLRAFAQKRKLNLTIDSAGTGNHHEGENPHPPSIKHAKKRGYDMSQLVARQIKLNDCHTFDLILCADKSNYSNVMRLCPKEYTHKVQMVTDYLPSNSKYIGATFVPDPWGGPASEYEEVLDIAEDSMAHLCHLIEQHSKDGTDDVKNL